MGNNYGNVVLVTGASSGIGKSIAVFLMHKGYHVYGTSRNISKMALSQQHVKNADSGGFIEMISLDILKDKSVKESVRYVLDKEGTLDILINNAGIGIAGSVEDTSIEEAQLQMDTNFYGAMRMIHHVLPIMRENRTGLIINISSVMGYLSLPFQSMYSSAKFALEALTEALRMEIAPFGIKACLIEPGDTKTGFTDNRIFADKSKSDGIYSKSFQKSISRMEKDERNGVSPEKVAKAVFNMIKMKNPPIRRTVGLQYKFVAGLKRLLPSRLTELMLSKIYG